MRAPLVLLTAAAVAVLAGCTEVPRSSAPDIVGSQGPQQPVQHANPPAAGALPYQIVQHFLEHNADGDPNNLNARQYLTQSANTRWTDDRVTVVSDDLSVGTAAGHPTVLQANPAELGTIDAGGVYTPVLTGDGTGRQQPFTFEVEHVKVPHYAKRQWRISSLPQGLIITSDEFQQLYQQRSVYFYDASEQHLVPDPRYTALVRPSELANWLLNTLATGPRDELSAAEQTKLPGQVDPSRVKVQIPKQTSSPTKITIPGAGQKGIDRLRLAIQVADTLEQVSQISTTGPLTIYDGDTPVSVPGVGTTFSASDFNSRISPPNVVPQLFYVDDGGGVVSEAGTPLPGRVGSGYYDLTSVALSGDAQGGGYLVAGTRGQNAAHRTLDIGTVSTPLRPVPHVSGLLSRPAWAPDVHEVWIGAGPALYRVNTKGVAAKVPMSTAKGDPAAGNVRAIRLSPEGSRVAIVLESADGKTSSVWVGNVERGGDTVRVDGLTQITATGVYVSDVAWNDALKLYAIGHSVRTDGPGYYELQCDGSRWLARGTGNIPGQLDAVTVATGSVLAVSASDTVWRQSGTGWQSPNGDRNYGAPGTAPVYVE